jgi:hypothetical protein
VDLRSIELRSNSRRPGVEFEFPFQTNSYESAEEIMRERRSSSAAHPSESTSHHEPLNRKPIFSSRSRLLFRDSAWLEACAILHWHLVHAVGSIEEDLFLHIHRVSAKIVTV